MPRSFQSGRRSSQLSKRRSRSQSSNVGSPAESKRFHSATAPESWRKLCGRRSSTVSGRRINDDHLMRDKTAKGSLHAVDTMPDMVASEQEETVHVKSEGDNSGIHVKSAS